MITKIFMIKHFKKLRRKFRPEIASFLMLGKERDRDRIEVTIQVPGNNFDVCHIP